MNAQLVQNKKLVVERLLRKWSNLSDNDGKGENWEWWTMHAQLEQNNGKHQIDNKVMVTVTKNAGYAQLVQ